MSRDVPRRHGRRSWRSAFWLVAVVALVAAAVATATASPRKKAVVHARAIHTTVHPMGRTARGVPRTSAAISGLVTRSTQFSANGGTSSLGQVTCNANEVPVAGGVSIDSTVGAGDAITVTHPLFDNTGSFVVGWVGEVVINGGSKLFTVSVVCST